MSKKKQAPQSGKKSLLLVILTVLILAGVGAVGAYAYTEINNLKSQVANNKSGNSESTPAENEVPVYVDLETFTVSLKPDSQDSDRILYIGLTLKLKNEEAKALLESHLPEVRSQLLVLFSQQTAAELVSDEAKKILADKVQTVVSASLGEKMKIAVTSVLFNAFILR